MFSKIWFVSNLIRVNHVKVTALAVIEIQVVRFYRTSSLRTWCLPFKVNTCFSCSNYLRSHLLTWSSTSSKQCDFRSWTKSIEIECNYEEPVFPACLQVFHIKMKKVRVMRSIVNQLINQRRCVINKQLESCCFLDVLLWILPI